MSDRFEMETTLYPLLSIAVTVSTLIAALALAKSIWGGIFLAGVLLLLCLFGYGASFVRLLPAFCGWLILSTAVFYVASGQNSQFAGQMAIRLGGVMLSIVPSLSLPPVKLVRCLTQLRCPRLLTLGMLITISFVPVLRGEIRQVRCAMRTRGAGSIFSPALFYRAFLIPLIVRLVNISDTLALSVETRGFVSEEEGYTVYHPVCFAPRDSVFAALFLLLLAVCGILSVKGVTLW